LQSRAERVQETGLHILPPSQCSDFGATLEANNSIEMCTGRKVEFDHIHQFRQILSKDKKRITFRSDGKVLNRLGTKFSKYNFYLGGTDSCQGEYFYSDSP
jgi:hypothetical protein